MLNDIDIIQTSLDSLLLRNQNKEDFKLVKFLFIVFKITCLIV